MKTHIYSKTFNQMFITSFIHMSLKLEKISVSINSRMNKQNMVYPYNRIQLKKTQQKHERISEALY